MIEALADDPGVASRGAEGDTLGFEEQDPRRRVEFGEEERGPEAGESAADDRDVGLGLALERRAERDLADVGEPEAVLLDQSECLA